LKHLPEHGVVGARGLFNLNSSLNQGLFAAEASLQPVKYQTDWAGVQPVGQCIK